MNAKTTHTVSDRIKDLTNGHALTIKMESEGQDEIALDIMGTSKNQSLAITLSSLELGDLIERLREMQNEISRMRGDGA